MNAESAAVAAPAALPVAQVKAVRRFNRFFTRCIGVLDPYLGGDLSLTDVRILYELAHREGLSATQLQRELALDGGYLSRILKRYDKAGWLIRTPNPKDARQSLLQLTDAGHALRAQVEEVLVELRRRVFQGVSESDLQACLRVFDALKVSLGRSGAGAQEDARP